MNIGNGLSCLHVTKGHLMPEVEILFSINLKDDNGIVRQQAGFFCTTKMDYITNQAPLTTLSYLFEMIRCR